MTQCRECGREIIGGTVRKEFCDDDCRGAFHRRRYRQQAVEEAEERREARLNGNGHATPEQRKEASEAMPAIIQALTPKFVRRI